MRTYGTLKLDGEVWAIECEPHVEVFFRRQFPQVGIGHLRITNTPDVCRDLEWFMSRYPLHVEREDVFQAGCAEQRRREEAVEDVFRGTYADVPLALPLRGYQNAAVATTRATHGTLVVDDLGLGKTPEGIGLTVYADARPAIVVTMTHLQDQWIEEYAKFAPNLRCKKIPGGPVVDYWRGGGGPDVAILNYHKLRKWHTTLMRYARSVVWDEVQELRKTDSEKYRAAHAVATNVSYRMGLTATPVYNYGGEMHPVMDCIQPRCLGTENEFHSMWCIGGKQNAILKNPDALTAYLKERGWMLRRSRADVGMELDPVTKIIHPIEADYRPLKDCQTAAERLAKIILGGERLQRAEAMQAHKEFQAIMRQATGLAKAPYVCDLVHMLVESEGKIVLWGWHKAVYAIYRERLARHNPVLYTGDESEHQKRASLQRFMYGDSRVFIMSLRSGAGLNGLQEVCSTGVFGELDWSPGIHNQCVGRLHRDGQRCKVMAFFPLSTVGSDPIMADVLKIKSDQSDAILGTQVELESIDPDRIRRLAEKVLRGSH